MFLSCIVILLLTIKYSECTIEPIQGRESTLYVDLDIIKLNYENLMKKLPPKHPVMAVVKANAYGVGDVAASQTLLELGATYLGVSFVDEGVHLRRHGIEAPILVLGYTSDSGSGIDLAIQYNLTLNVFTEDVLNAVQSRAMLFNSDPVKIHIKVNSGMNRLGIEPDQLVSFLKLIESPSYSKVIVEGIFSHFATLKDVPATSRAENYARKQLYTFKRAVKEARKVIDIPLAHIANSGGIDLFGHEAALDMVRPGSAILGFTTSSRYVMSLTSIVSAIRQPAKGQQLGYEQNATANGQQLIATVPLGYADGLRTECGLGQSDILIKGIRVPVVSGIMMDQMLIDASRAHPVTVGESVVVFGRQNGAEISIDEHVKRCGRTDAVVFTSQLNKRLPRVYLRNGQTVYFENNLLSFNVLIK